MGAARLGLATVLAARSARTRAACSWRLRCAPTACGLVAPHDGLTATTVVMPAHCDRALVTFDPGARVRSADIEALAPRAVVCGMGRS